MSNFRQSSWIRMLKTHNMAQMCCPLGLSGKITAVYQMKKSQIVTETDKNSKFFVFHCCYAIFVKFLNNFVDWKVLKVQQGQGWLSRSLFRRVYCICSKRNCLKSTPKMTKIPNSSYCSFLSENVSN